MTKQEFLEEMKGKIDQMDVDDFIDAVHDSRIFLDPEVPSIFPMQPVHITEGGIARFVQNRIVVDALDVAILQGFDMNQIAIRAAQGDYSKDEQMQFAQLIGYSVDGYGSLSYTTDLSYEEAQEKITGYIKKELKIEE